MTRLSGTVDTGEHEKYAARGAEMSKEPKDGTAPVAWSSLKTSQLGRYAEYVVRMEMARLGCDVYVPEVDDKGIDLVVRLAPGSYAEVQAKGVRGYSYVFMRKNVFPLSASRYLALVRFTDGRWPDVYLIPATAWLTPDAVFTSRDYVGRKSAPEWGLNLSAKAMPLLEPFRLERQVSRLLEGASQSE